MVRFYRIFVLGAVVGLFAVLNLALPSVFWNTSPRQFTFYVNFFFVGGLVAEAGLLSIWAALGPQRAPVRIPITLGLLALLTSSYILGLQIPDDSMPLDVVIVLCGAAVMLFCAMQVPLWVLRSRWGQRIALRAADNGATDNGATDNGATDNESSQFGLRHMLLWTTLISAVLVLGKYSLPDGSLTTDTPWGAILVVLAVCTLFATLVGLPCIWLTLSAQGRLPWLAWLLAVGTIGPAVVMMILVVALGAPRASNSMLEIMAALYCLGVGAASCMLLTLLICRGLGFRLVGPDDWLRPPAAIEEANLPEAEITD